MQPLCHFTVYQILFSNSTGKNTLRQQFFAYTQFLNISKENSEALTMEEYQLAIDKIEDNATWGEVVVVVGVGLSL